MKITSLQLQNFRLYHERTFSFTHEIVAFVGPNAIGKTNLLEALTLLAVGKSFRAHKDEDMIAFGEDFGRVKATIEEDTLEVVLTRGWWQGKRVAKKRFLLNGVGKRRKDFLGTLRVVLFEPQDIELIIGSPGKRRNYLDFVLTQTDWEYVQSLLAYEKGLRQRNKLLALIADSRAKTSQLEFWNRLLVKNGEVIRKKRAAYLEFLTNYCTSYSFKETIMIPSLQEQGAIPRYVFEYLPSVISEERLYSHQEAEIASKTTLVGPHRDNFILYQSTATNIQETKDLELYGSRGEQRMAVLAMKLGELEFMQQKTGERPVLLLDDIFSELDNSHRQVIAKVMTSQQTFLTTTDNTFISLKDPKQVQVIELS